MVPTVQTGTESCIMHDSAFFSTEHKLEHEDLMHRNLEFQQELLE